MPASDPGVTLSSAKPKADPCAAVAAEFTHIPSVKHDPKGGPMDMHTGDEEYLHLSMKYGETNGPVQRRNGA